MDRKQMIERRAHSRHGSLQMLMDIVYRTLRGYEKPMTCKDCKHWQRITPKAGACRLEQIGTTEDFSCKMHEPIPVQIELPLGDPNE